MLRASLRQGKDRIAAIRGQKSFVPGVAVVALRCLQTVEAGRPQHAITSWLTVDAAWRVREEDPTQENQTSEHENTKEKVFLILLITDMSNVFISQCK